MLRCVVFLFFLSPTGALTSFLDSLLPAPLHVGVAKLCIKNSTSLVTASYVSSEMNGLHAEAKEADVVLLNELGLVSSPRGIETNQD